MKLKTAKRWLVRNAWKISHDRIYHDLRGTARTRRADLLQKHIEKIAKLNARERKAGLQLTTSLPLTNRSLIGDQFFNIVNRVKDFFFKKNLLSFI